MALLCSSCSLTTSTPSWEISRAAPLLPLAPSAWSGPAPRRKLNSSCVDCSPDRITLPPSPHITPHTGYTHTHTLMRNSTTAAHTCGTPFEKFSDTFNIHLVGKTEGLHLKGLLKEGIIEKELAKYILTSNTAAAAAAKDDVVVLCGLYSEQRLCGATFLWTSTCFD